MRYLAFYTAVAKESDNIDICEKDVSQLLNADAGVISWNSGAETFEELRGFCVTIIELHKYPRFSRIE
jgi:hypothetical protein